MKYSALFINDEKINNIEPAFFKDLKLDIIVKACFSNKDDNYLIPYFYTALNDKETIIYRQDVFKELEDESLSQRLRIFISKIISLKQLNDELVINEQYASKARLFKMMNEYNLVLNDFYNDLSKFNLKAKALIDFKNYLKGYLESNSFLDFLSDIKNIKEVFKGIKFSFVIDGTDIYVSKYEDDKDYSLRIKKASSLFSYNKEFKKPTDFSYIQTLNVDNSIYEKLAIIYDKEFKLINSFFKKNKGFFNNDLFNIAKEFRFYYIYLQFINKIKNDNLKFSIPNISDSFIENSNNSFDLALAYKYLRENRTIITNSYVINKNEKTIIISGPNQGGKTTFTRQFGQLHYLLKLGVPVQGENNNIHLVDGIYSFFKTEENLDNLDGKLKIELEAVKKILANASNNSIILFNEIFASTTAEDGLKIANLVLDEINNLGSFCVFVTFLSELKNRDGVVLMCSNVEEANKEIRTYKITRTESFDSAYPSSIQAKYGLTYDNIRRRIKNEN